MNEYPIEVYKKAIATVPAYQQFIKEQCGQTPTIGSMEDFKKLPFMDKASYINVFPLAQRCLDGTLRGKHIIMHSSGSSGKYQHWPSIPELEKKYWQGVYDELNASYDISNKATLIILGVLMGGNMSGALFAYALRAMGIETGQITLITPGRDEAACIEDIAEFSPQFEQTILYSYPATAKNIIENAAAKGIPVQDMNIKLRLLGEGYSEAFRDRVNQLLGYAQGYLASVNSGYGATDFRGAGRESLLCVAIKRILYENSLVKKVLGFDEMPSICQYDPQSIFIEEDEGELVMTKHNAVPLVRYRSGDAGTVMSYEQMMALLAEHSLDVGTFMKERGCDPLTVTKKPFVLVNGRKDGRITFYGTKIFVSKIKTILEETPFLVQFLTGEFQLRKREDAALNPILELLLVLRPGSSEPNAEEIADVVADELARVQGGIFADLLVKDRNAARPRIRFVLREEIMTSASFKIRYIG